MLYIFQKTLALSIIAVTAKMKSEEKSIEIFKILEKNI